MSEHEEHGLTLTPGSSPSALRNLEQALVHVPLKEISKLRFSFKLRDGRQVNDVIVRAAMKARERRDDAMVDTIDKLRLAKANAPDGESIFLEFQEIAGWQVEEPPEA